MIKFVSVLLGFMWLALLYCMLWALLPTCLILFGWLTLLTASALLLDYTDVASKPTRQDLVRILIDRQQDNT